MTAADLPAVLALEQSCHAHPWSAELFRQELDNPLSAVELFWLGNKLAGFLCAWQVAGELHIQNVATDPDCRRRGIAAELLRRAFVRAIAHGCGRALLEVRVSNAGAISLYEKFGFRIIARRPRYYADGEDALVMECRFPEHLSGDGRPCGREEPAPGVRNAKE